MEDVGAVHVLECFEQLIHGVLLVNVLQDASTDDSVQVGLHVLKDEVDVPIIVCLEHVEEFDDVLVSMEFLKEHDLTECTLGICGILEGIKYLLECNCLSCFLVYCFPHNTISLTQKLVITDAAM